MCSISMQNKWEIIVFDSENMFPSLNTQQQWRRFHFTIHNSSLSLLLSCVSRKKQSLEFLRDFVTTLFFSLLSCCFVRHTISCKSARESDILKFNASPKWCDFLSVIRRVHFVVTTTHNRRRLSFTFFPLSLVASSIVLTGNFDECVLNEAMAFPLLYNSDAVCCCCCCSWSCCCWRMVGDGEMPVEPGIIGVSMLLPFIVYVVSWPPYIVAKKNFTIDSASDSGSWTMDFVAGTSLAVNNNKLRWSAARARKPGRVVWRSVLVRVWSGGEEN